MVTIVTAQLGPSKADVIALLFFTERVAAGFVRRSIIAAVVRSALELLDVEVWVPLIGVSGRVGAFAVYI
ncbi:hypothetical protein [Bacillus thuringiensis]|uniref:hypothetical protein n=1 Tax=Bacillus thuringiensis TaxID=1428 RepID=UPI001C5527A1|nr:hypothetical protein [Bacillus thuringiensis]